MQQYPTAGRQSLILELCRGIGLSAFWDDGTMTYSSADDEERECFVRGVVKEIQATECIFGRTKERTSQLRGSKGQNAHKREGEER